MGLCACAVKVERGEITCSINSDVEGLGQGNMNEVDGGCILLVSSNTEVPPLHLLGTV